MANDTLQIVVNPLTKRITRVVGAPLINNIYDLTVINIGDADPADLLLQILKNGSLFAEVPVGGFSLSGSDADAELDLRTVPLVSFFAGHSSTGTSLFDIVIQDTVEDDTVCSDRIRLQNNPVSPGATPPTTPGNSVTVNGATVVGEVAKWASVDGELDNAGYPVENALTGTVDVLTTSEGIFNALAVAWVSITGLAASYASTLKRTAGDFVSGIVRKNTPADLDRLLIEDSADGFAKKWVRVVDVRTLPGAIAATDVTNDATLWAGTLATADINAQLAFDRINNFVILTAGQVLAIATGEINSRGFVVGPTASVDYRLGAFDGITGKLLRVSPLLTDANGMLTFPVNAISGAMKIPPRAVVPTTPATGHVYLDDGTNTDSGRIGFRGWDGAAWRDLSGGSGGGGAENDIMMFGWMCK